MKYSIGTIKDPHYSYGFLNRIRIDYENDINNKNAFIIKELQARDINDLFFTGDIFDNSSEDKWSFKKYKKNKRILQSFPFDIYSCLGNHDMFYGLEDSDETVFGEMVIDNIIKDVTKEPKIIIDSNNKLIIQGVNFSHSHEKIFSDIEKLNSLEEDNINLCKVIILHSNIFPDDVVNDSNKRFLDFTYSHLATTFENIDLFICGHFHKGFPTTKIKRKNNKDCIFVNNWNLTRVVRDYEAELDQHKPELEIIDFYSEENGFRINTETIQIPVKKFKDTFHHKIIDLLKKNKKEIFEFFENINIKEIKELTEDKENKDLINDIKVKYKFSDDAILLALDYLNGEKGLE